jgi:nitrogen fixation protein NifU and related proteins
MFDVMDLYQQMINDHGKNPRNFGRLADADHEAEGYNPLCGDKLHVYLKTSDEGLIEDVSFEGEGCRISMASASLMTEAVKGKPLADFLKLFEDFQHMVTSDISESPDEGRLGKLAVLSGVREFPSRIKCATLCWHTLKSAVKGGDDVAKTE